MEFKTKLRQMNVSQPNRVLMGLDDTGNDAMEIDFSRLPVMIEGFNASEFDGEFEQFEGELTIKLKVVKKKK